MFSENSPLLCRPLHAVFDTVDPYVGPVYDDVYSKHVQPYVERVEPFVSQGFAVYQRHVQPRLLFVAGKIGEPASHAIGKFVGPYIQTVERLYDEKLGPHVQKASQLTDQTYRNYIEPVYSRASRQAVVVVRAFDDNVMPHVSKYSSLVVQITYKYSYCTFNWLKVKVVPRIVKLYTETIEPQLHKISARIWQGGDLAGHLPADLPDHLVPPKAAESSVSEQPVVSAEPEVPAEPEVFEPQVTGSAESVRDSDFKVPTPEPPTESSVPVAEQETANEFPEQFPHSLQTPHCSTETSLARWNQMVKDTTREALDSFLDDVEEEKQKLMDQIRPQFTTLLRALSKAETDAVSQLSDLVKQIEESDEEEEITPQFVQQQFRAHADAIRDGAMAVRKLSLEFAEIVINQTEEIRRSTVDVLDEFADIALQEIGRKLVSAGSDSSVASSSSNGPNWKDWQEYRSLKERLIQSRDEIINHEINMAEVNQMLREAQETANILAKEAAQYLSSLRSKADYLFQQRLAAKDVGDEVPDAEFYEELEEEEHTDNEGETAEETAEEADYDEEPERITMTQIVYETLYPEPTEPVETFPEGIFDEEELEDEILSDEPLRDEVFSEEPLGDDVLSDASPGQHVLADAELANAAAKDDVSGIYSETKAEAEQSSEHRDA